MRRSLRTRRPPIGQKDLRSGKLRVRNAKLDHPVSQEAAAAPGRQHELEASKCGSSSD
jgi:hypothetical protein